MAIYANLAKPAAVDERFDVRLFVESGAQHRALYLFSASGAGVMAAFVVYGAVPGGLFSEDVSACAAPRFASLERFAQGGAAVVDQTLDLGRRARVRGMTLMLSAPVARLANECHFVL